MSKDWLPIHYHLDLSINPDEADISGQVRIDVSVNQPRDHYFIHGNLLKVSSVILTDSKGKHHNGEYSQVDKSGVARIVFNNTITVGQSALKLTYHSPFNEALEGLYRVLDGGLNYAFTQFEATSVRLAFPGFDEPAFKVPFDVSITAPVDMYSVANTLLVKLELLKEKPGFTKSTYATTEPFRLIFWPLLWVSLM